MMDGGFHESSLSAHVRLYTFSFCSCLGNMCKTDSRTSQVAVFLQLNVPMCSSVHQEHAYIILTHLIPKVGFTGVYIISAKNIDCEYSLEPPRRCGSNEYPQSMFLGRNMNKSCQKTTQLAGKG